MGAQPVGSLRKYITGYMRFDRELDSSEGQHKIFAGLYEDDAGNVFVHCHPEETWVELGYSEPGPPGPQGDIGPVGPQGPAGVSALSVTVSAGKETWRNMPAGRRFLFDSWLYVTKVDLAHVAQARLVVTRGPGAVSPANARLALVYATVFSTDVNVYGDIGIGPIEANISPANSLIVTPWVDLAGPARDDICVSVIGYGGDGKDDPVFGSVLAQFR